MAPKFCHRQGTGLKAGVDLSKLLKTEAAHGPTRHREAIGRVAAGVSDGNQLHEMMAQDRYFPRLMTAMVRVGEETGKLDHTMLTLAEHYQHKLTTRRWFVSAIAWPVLQLLAGIGVISLLILVLGMLTPRGGGEMADVLGFGLRGPVGVLWFWFYLALFFGAIALLIWGFVRNVAGVQNLIPLFYRVPVAGPAIQTITLSRFCWTLALSLGAGLDPIRAIKLALDSTDSNYYRTGAADAESAIRSGATLGGALDATGLFPDDFVQRVEVAEQSGTDAESIEYLTREYDQRAKQAVRVIAGIATAVIWLSIAAALIFLIFRLFSFYVGAIYDNLP